MSCSEGKTIKVKPSLHMKMEVRIQTNLPLDTLLHSCVQGWGSRIFPWRRSLSQSINFPCKNFKDIFSPPSVLNRRSFTGCNPSVYQKQEEEDCLERAGPEIQSPDVYVATLSRAPSQSICIETTTTTTWNYLTFQKELFLDKSFWLYKSEVMTFRSVAKCPI